MNPAGTTRVQRPRGRPPLDPVKATMYRSQVVRIRKDGSAHKSPTRVRRDHVEAWLDVHQGEYWHGSCRPPKGESRTLVRAVMDRFQISRRTVSRLVADINERRGRQSAQARGPLTPMEAGLLAALAMQHQKATPISMPEGWRRSASDAVASTYSVSAQGRTAKKTQLGQPILSEKIDTPLVHHGILRVLTECSDQSFLEVVDQVIARRLGRTVDAPRDATNDLLRVGLRVAPAPTSMADLTLEALLEALGAYLATARPGPRVRDCAAKLEVALRAP